MNKLAIITGIELNKIKGEDNPYTISAKDSDNKPLADVNVEIAVNGIRYIRKTDNEGIASLNINLNCGRYVIGATLKTDEYVEAQCWNMITVSPLISTTNLTLHKGEESEFTCILTDVNGLAIEGCSANININGVDYARISNDAGYISKKVALNEGEYEVFTNSYDSEEFNKITITSKPKVATFMEGTDLNKAKSDKSVNYQCAVYAEGKRVYDEVEITVNNKTYIKTADSNGLYHLNINLSPGTYKIDAVFKGTNDYIESTVVNNCVIVEDPKTGVFNPIQFIRQSNGNNCGPSVLAMLSQVKGNPISQAAFVSACKTNSNGTTPDNLIAGAKSKGFKLAKINRTFEGVKNSINNKKPCCFHIQTKGVACLGFVNDYGHYIACYNIGNNTFLVVCPTKGFAVCNASSLINATGGRSIYFYDFDTA
jgi:hypothetical protein